MSKKTVKVTLVRSPIGTRDSHRQTVLGLQLDKVWQGAGSRTLGLQGRLSWVHEFGDLEYAASGTYGLSPGLPTVKQANAITVAPNRLRGAVRMSAALGRQSQLSLDLVGTWAKDQNDWLAGLSYQFNW